MKVEPEEKFIIKPLEKTTESGEKEAIENMYILTLGRPLSNLADDQGGEAFQSFIANVGGLESVKTIGAYSIMFEVACTFDPAKVIAAIEDGIGRFVSEVVIVPAGAVDVQKQ